MICGVGAPRDGHASRREASAKWVTDREPGHPGHRRLPEAAEDGAVAVNHENIEVIGVRRIPKGGDGLMRASGPFWTDPKPGAHPPQTLGNFAIHQSTL